ncbi:unnamed protein product [Dicrocoelium dendriticum]|nr:unnamed protein product [Dicrocoelium dendriticum]
MHSLACFEFPLASIIALLKSTGFPLGIYASKKTTKGMDTSKVTDKLKGGMDYVKSMFQGMGGSGSDQRYTLDELNDYVDRKKISMDKEKIKSCFQPDQHGKMDLNEFCKKMSDHVTPSEDSALRNPKKMVE